MSHLSPTELSSPTNHVFVDFENVHQIDLSVIGAKTVNLILLLGAQQKKLDAELVEKLMEHSASVQLIRLTSSGKNSLDFALAYYVGRAVIVDPTAYFHIVSRDTGYDPLIEHLRNRHIKAYRHDDFTTLTFSYSGAQKPPSSLSKAPLSRALEHLRKHTKNRPKRKKTLVRHLLGLCGNDATETEALELIESLRKAGHVSFGEKGAVTYKV